MLLLLIIKLSRQNPTPQRPNVIINEVKISPEDKFVELRSEEKSVSLNGFQLICLEFSKEREKDSYQQLKLRGVMSLNGKTTHDHLAFIGLYPNIFHIG